MAKSLVLGNGGIFVGLDRFGQVKDFYFPYVGLENHVGRGCGHRIGVWVDNTFSWVSDGSWSINIQYERGTLASAITANNEHLGVRLYFTDVVYNESNIFVRHVKVENTWDRDRTIKVFFAQQFFISETHFGNTAYVMPDAKSIVHYKGRRVFIVSGKSGKNFFDEYSVGLLGIEGREGTWKDAEDGQLSRNTIEHGSVDSAIGFTIFIKAGLSQKISYWIVAGETYGGAHALHLDVLARSPAYLITSTKDYWRAWLTKRTFVFHGLEDRVQDLFEASLMVVRVHADNRGAIIASGDSDILQYGRDTYSYVWPRDGAFAALALTKAGYFRIGERFFEFCNESITEGGFLLHKYNSDRSLGASWHPWIQDGKAQLPIQEDETALVVWVLWEHYRYTRDMEFVERIYNSLIRKSADFLIEYRDKKTGLPLPSYDLWEERRGTHCFTVASVYGALIAAAGFADLLGKEVDVGKYRRVAEEIAESLIQHFYDEKNGYFVRTVWFEDGEITKDETVDSSSAYGIFRFGVLPVQDKRLSSAWDKTLERLGCIGNVGGLARYEGDRYQRVSAEVPGNPWILTTLWYVEYMIAVAKTEADLFEAKYWIHWVADRGHDANMLPEQVNPFTGAPLSVSPLTWSHARFVLVVVAYLEKLEKLGVCKTCYPVK
jgi:GH15 family glucan-1,4-alpha-glucosidase